MKKVKHHEIEYKQQMQLERHIIRTSQKNNKRNLTPLYPKSQKSVKKTRKARMGGTQEQRTENKQIKAHNK